MSAPKRSRPKERKRKRRGRARKPTFVYPSVSYSTERLVAAATQLRALGAPGALQKKAYRPFIIQGEADWTDTWGAPRAGVAGKTRKHRGQDIFCDEGASVLAPVGGRIEFGHTSLGGKVARLYDGDGSYLYFAHLSGWNDDFLSSGDTVRSGQVIGYCGDSGNAEGTSPHVHLGWYERGGISARDPHEALVAWLRQAESNSARLIARRVQRHVRQASVLRAKRMFGGPILPSLAVLDCEQTTRAARAISRESWPLTLTVGESGRS